MQFLSTLSFTYLYCFIPFEVNSSCSSQAGLQSAILTTYEYELEWLLDAFPILQTIPVLLVHGEHTTQVCLLVLSLSEVHSSGSSKEIFQFKGQKTCDATSIWSESWQNLAAVLPPVP